MLRKTFNLIAFVLIVGFIEGGFAQNGYSQNFDNFTVHHSVFSSTVLSAEIAEQYKLIRSKDRVFINIAVIPNNQTIGGVEAVISGTAANLMQQQKTLEFHKITETGTTYYLASLRHTDREVFHFLINVDPPGPEGPYQLKFTKELYVNP